MRAAAVLLLTFALSGCAAPILVSATSALQVAQYGATTFSGGSLDTVYAQPFDKTQQVVRAVADELAFKVLFDHPADGFLYIDLQDLDGEEVHIRVKKHTAAITSVSIRVGFLGDHPYSNAIMARITAGLGPSNIPPDEAAPEKAILPPASRPR
jgi:hypothetical protein